MLLRSLVLSTLLVSLPMTACAQHLGYDAPNHLPSTTPTMTESYGADPMQSGDLRLPDPAKFGKGPYPVAIVIHGGCWTDGVATRRHSAALASSLTGRGIATWNIDYRLLGGAGGGWPGTLQDWGAATDHLRDLARTQPLDLSRVLVMGHSAGGHAALWVAARSKIPAGTELSASNPLPVIAAIDLDGPGDLRPTLGYEPTLCGDAAEQLLGGTAGQQPDRFNIASPSMLLPLGVPQYLVSSVFLPLDAANRYRDMAVAKGDSVTIIDQTKSGHYEMVSPGQAEERQIEDLVVNLLQPVAH